MKTFGVAGINKAVEIGKFVATGVPILKAVSEGSVSSVLGVSRVSGGATTPLAMDTDTKFTNDDVGYSRDGTTLVFTGNSLQTPVVPGSVVIDATAGSPAVKDTLKDGILYLDGPARKRASGGTFAAMAGESMVIKIDGDKEQTITFGTEASISLAVTKINSLLKSGIAVAQGAQNVDIYSNSSGVNSSVEVVSVAAGITTKLGISAGTSTTAAGTVNYFTGALTVSYPGGYAPSTGDAGLAVLLGTLAGPWVMNPADTLVVNTNAGGNETATFAAAPATVTGTGGAFAAMASETMKVQFENGLVQTITFGTEATIAAAVALMNDQLEGGYAASVDANNVKIVSDVHGTGSRVRTSSVAAGITTKIGIANSADQAGTGDVANIKAVTAAEAKTVIEADTTGLTVTPVENKLKLTAVTSIKVDASSTLETVFGLSTTIATPTSGGSAPLYVNYVKGAILAAGGTTLRKVYGAGDDEISCTAAGLNGSCKISIETL